MRGTPFAKMRGNEGLTLIELLISMIVLGIVTTLLVGIWTALQSSYANTVNNQNAQQIARDAMARMRRDIRDMQQQQRPGDPLLGEPMILVAGPNEIQFTTPFTNSASGYEADILLTRYWYASSNKELWRERDTNNNGVFDTGDLKQLVAKNIVNAVVPNAGSPTPLFTYTFYAANGTLQKNQPTVAGDGDRRRIATIQIKILADLNPSHSPVYMELITTVQPRNLRPI